MRTPQKLSRQELQDALSNDPHGSYIPDVIKGTVLVAAVVVTLRLYPMKTSALLSVVARRIRFTPTKHPTHISFDGVPYDLFSLGVPHRRTK